jgi:hypothetical protein
MEPSRSSAMPLANNTNAAVAGGGEPPYDGGMEHRMTALETRLDTILPTLATKADVEAVRADVDKLAISTNAQFAELRTELRAEFDKATLSTDTKLGELRGEFDKAGLSTDAKLGELRAEFAKAGLSTDAKLGELRAEFAKAGLSTDAKLGELRADMQKMNAEIKTWTLATMITIVGTMLAAIFGISQIYKGTTPASQAPINITIPVPLSPAAPADTK